MRLEVDLEDAIHARKRDHDSLGDGQGAAGVSVRSAGDEGDAFACAEADDRLKLLGAGRKNDQRGRPGGS